MYEFFETACLRRRIYILWIHFAASNGSDKGNTGYEIPYYFLNFSVHFILLLSHDWEKSSFTSEGKKEECCFHLPVFLEIFDPAFLHFIVLILF